MDRHVAVILAARAWKRLAVLLLLLAGCLPRETVHAAFPDQVTTIVVPFDTGDSLDLHATNWYALFVHRDTPPEFAALLAKTGTLVDDRGAARFKAFLGDQ